MRLLVLAAATIVARHAEAATIPFSPAASLGQHDAPQSYVEVPLSLVDPFDQTLGKLTDVRFRGSLTGGVNITLPSPGAYSVRAFAYMQVRSSEGDIVASGEQILEANDFVYVEGAANGYHLGDSRLFTMIASDLAPILSGEPLHLRAGVRLDQLAGPPVTATAYRWTAAVQELSGRYEYEPAAAVPEPTAARNRLALGVLPDPIATA